MYFTNNTHKTILYLFIALFINGCGSTSKLTNDNITLRIDNFITYKFSYNPIKLEYPSNWTIDEDYKSSKNGNLDEYTSVILTPSEDPYDRFSENLMIQRIPLDEITNNMQELPNDLANFKITKSTETTLLSQPSLIIEAQGSYNQVDFKFIQYIILRNGYYYILSFTSETNKYSSYISTIESVVKSIQFTDEDNLILEFGQTLNLDLSNYIPQKLINFETKTTIIKKPPLSNLTIADETSKLFNINPDVFGDYSLEIEISSNNENILDKTIHISTYKKFNHDIANILIDSNSNFIWTDFFNSYGIYDKDLNLLWKNSTNLEYSQKILLDHNEQFLYFFITGPQQTYTAIKTNLNGAIISQKSIEGDQGNGGIDAVIDSEGNIYTYIKTHSFTKKLNKYDNSLNLVWSKTIENYNFSCKDTIQIDSNGLIMVLSVTMTNYSSYLYKYNENGDKVSEIRLTNYGPSYYGREPNFFKIDCHNNIYIAYDYTLMKYNSTAEKIWEFHYSEGWGNEIKTIAIDKSENIYLQTTGIDMMLLDKNKNIKEYLPFDNITNYYLTNNNILYLSSGKNLFKIYNTNLVTNSSINKVKLSKNALTEIIEKQVHISLH